MSWKATAYVAELTDNITRSEKLLLLCLSNRYNDDEGCAWVSVPKLAREALMSDRTVHQAIDGLVRKGFLLVGERPGQSSVYLINGVSGREPTPAKTAGVINWRTPADPEPSGAKTAGVPPQKELITSDVLDSTAADEQRTVIRTVSKEPADARSRDHIATTSREGDAISENVGSGGEKATSARRGGDMDAFGRALLAQRLNPRTLDAIAEHATVKVEGVLLRVECRDEQLFRELTREPTRSMVNNAAEEAGYAVNRIVRAVA